MENTSHQTPDAKAHNPLLLIHQPQSLPARKPTIARLKPIHELLIAHALLHPRIPAFALIPHLQR